MAEIILMPSMYKFTCQWDAGRGSILSICSNGKRLVRELNYDLFNDYDGGGDVG